MGEEERRSFDGVGDYRKLIANIDHMSMHFGPGVTDECINCHEQIVSTGISFDYNEHLGNRPVTPIKNYDWTHVSTNETKCVGIEGRWAAGIKMPPQNRT